MKSIAIVHPDMSINGGGEAVCAHVIDSLANEYEVELVSWSEPDREQLDDLFGTTLTHKEFKTVVVGGNPRAFSAITKRAAIQFALAARYVQKHIDRYDAVISTWCEIAVSRPAIQYVHVPLFTGGIKHEWLSGVKMSPGNKALWACLRTASRKLARGSLAGYRRSVSVSNSQWTADLVQKTLGSSSFVLWPPIPKLIGGERSWSDRENGFVCIGRLVPGKRVLEVIECMRRVRRAGLDVRLHIVGAGTGEYADAVIQKCLETDGVTYHGRMSKAAMFELINRNRFGIHGFPFEHFGIAVAQMISAGCLCFVPKGGGQSELVGGQDELLYEDFDDAANKIIAVLSEPDRQAGLLHSLRSIRTSLKDYDFQKSFRNLVVAELLNP